MRVIVLTLLATWCSCSFVEAQSRYRFNRVADSAQLPGLAGASCLALNDRGAVMFTTSDGAVWLANGTAVTQLAAPGAAGHPYVLPCPGLNNNDEVVYGFAFASPTYDALVRNSGGTTTELARSDVFPFLMENGDTAIHSLTSAGSTVMKAADGRLYLMPSGTPAYVIDPAQPVPFSVMPGTMNDSNAAAFYALRQGSSGTQRAGIYRGSVVPLVEDGNATVDLVGAARPVINGSGVVAFLGSLHDGRNHVLTTADGLSFVDHSVNIGGELSLNLALNDAGTVVFAARTGTGGWSLYTGPDAVNDKVIGPGDSLDGSTVTTAYVWQEGLNSSGQIAFWARLADGRSGVYRADPIAPPVAYDDTLSVIEDQATSGTLRATDSANLPLTYSVVSNGSKGTVTVTDPATGAFTYTPNLHARGTDTFTFRANNGARDSNVATVTVTIARVGQPAVNHAPTAWPAPPVPTAVAYHGPGDQLARTTNLPPIGSYTMMGWFRITGDGHTYSTMLALGHATSSNAYLVMLCCGNGWDQLALWTGNAFLTGSSLTLGTWNHLAISVEGPGPGQVKVYLNGALNITANGNAAVTADRMSIGNDSHTEWMDGNVAGVKVYDAALNAGEIAQEMTQFAPVRTAGLNSWYPLIDSADAPNDYSGNRRTLAMTGAPTTVAGPPLAAGAFVTRQNTAVSGQLQATDPDGDPLTYALVGNGTRGVVTVTDVGTGAFVYTPNRDANGVDTFTFKASDGLVDSNVATVTVLITPVNQPPVVSDGVAAVDSGAAVSGTIVAHDIDSPRLTFAIVANGTKGTAVVDPSTGAYVYRANDVARGTDTFTVKANDGQLDSNIATITVTITPVNHAPRALPAPPVPTAVALQGPTGEFVRTTNLPPITSYTMMGWFRITADNHSYSTMLALSHPTSSSAYLVMLCCGNGWDQLALWTGNAFPFGSNLPVGTWNHIAITVGSGPGQVKVYLNGVLNITADPNPAITAERLSIGNDSHREWMDGNLSSVKVYDVALSAGEVAQEMTQFAPVRTAGLNSWYPFLSSADATTDYSGNYRTLTMTGAPATVAGPPLAAGAFVTRQNTALSGQLQAVDVDGDPVTYALVANGPKGVVTITDPATGAFTYTPNRDANGIDTFTFKANDGLLDSNIAAVTVLVTPVNQPPVLSDGSAAVDSGASVSDTIVAHDIDSPHLTFAVVTNGTKGTAVVDPATGAFVYTANYVASGIDTFTVKANDGQLDSNVATITVTITPVNHAPTALAAPPVPTAVAFHGSADELVRTTNLPPITGFTMMGWFRITGDAHTYSTMLGLSHPTSSNGYVVMLCCGNGWDSLALWTGNAFPFGSRLTLGTWNHIAITVAGSGPGQVKVYLNGAVNITANGNPAITAERLSIANDAHGEWLDGNVAAVKVYDVPLSDAEIAQEMTQFAPVRTAGLNSWYPLVSSADAVSDYSGNNRTLTMTGGPTTVAGPPLSPGAIMTPQNTAVSGQLQAFDVDGDPVSYALVGNAGSGVVTITDAATGAFTYTPNAGATGVDTFRFRVNDGRLDSNVATVMVIITRQ